jgi:hypothetical protein
VSSTVNRAGRDVHGLRYQEGYAGTTGRTDRLGAGGEILRKHKKCH